MSKWKTISAVAAGALTLSAALAAAGTAQASPGAASAAGKAAASHQQRPTIVLVAGAFEDSSVWSGEVSRLQQAGYRVTAPAVPLRSVASDSAYLTSLVRSIKGPVVLVGHSYGGILITQIAASDPRQVKALVYTAAYIPQAGESALQLTTQFPGSLIGPATTAAVSYPGGTDTYVRPADFRAVVAGDQSAATAAQLAAIQRPVESAALSDPATAGVPSGLPLYAVVAAQDKAIPPAAERFEARRAGAVIFTVNSAHDLPASHPAAVTAVIERAAG